MNSNLPVAIVPLTNRAIAAICMWRILASSCLLLGTGYVHAQATSNLPLTLTIQFDTGTTHKLYTKTLDPAKGQTSLDDSSTGTSPTGGRASASIHVQLKSEDHWQIVQRAQTDGIEAQVSVGWYPIGVAASGTLSATFSCPNPAFPCGANASYLWDGRCLFVSPYNYGPQGTCQTHYGGLSYTTTYKASGQPPATGRSFVECITGTCNDTVTTDVDLRGDTVTVANSSGVNGAPAEVGLFVNGDATLIDNTQWIYERFDPTTQSTCTPQGGGDLCIAMRGNLSSSIDSSANYNQFGNQVVGFALRHPVALIEDPMVWTDNIDDVVLPFADEIKVPLKVWVIKGPFSDQVKMITQQIGIANQVYTAERSGISLQLQPPIEDKTAVGGASAFYGAYCSAAGHLPYEFGFDAGAINIYLIESIDKPNPNVLGGVEKGVAYAETCHPLYSPVPAFLILMSNTPQTDTLAHELGHAFGLGHVGEDYTQLVNNFSSENVMWGGPLRDGEAGDFLSEGQNFRINLSTSSAVNLLKLRSGPTRHCESISASFASMFAPQSRTCPAIDRRLWADGLQFPPN